MTCSSFVVAPKVFTAEHVAGAAKSAKRKAIEEKRALANSSIAELHEMKRHKREKAMAKSAERRALKLKSDPVAGGFDEDISRNDKRKSMVPKERTDRSAKKDEFTFKEKITNLRKQGKRSVKSFKSKGRYNRRG
jgi:ATP-dependent RNA helicase DDX27